MRHLVAESRFWQKINKQAATRVPKAVYDRGEIKFLSRDSRLNWILHFVSFFPRRN